MDQTIRLLREGYPWAARLREGSVAASTRLLGRPAVVVGGPEGVRRFYDRRLRRRGAFPPPIKLVLFGPGAVHGLDDAEHHARKSLFLDVLTPDAVAQLGDRVADGWHSAQRAWDDGQEIVLFDEAVGVIGGAVLAWAGIRVAEADVPRRSRELAAIVDGFATFGGPYLRAVGGRLAVERWARSLVRAARRGEALPPPGSALARAAQHRDDRGRLLPVRVAAVELLNLVRPTVAVAWFVAFAGHALHEHPEWRDRVAGGDEAALEAFAQEVRRYYPFVPVLAARARHAQDVLGFPLRRGGLVVLDVHGTDHDPQHWPEPDRFDPGRFLQGAPDPDTLVPQGGGDVTSGHRCPGESAALTVIRESVRFLASLSVTVPPQDLDWPLNRMPTRPRSGVRLRLASAAASAVVEPQVGQARV